MNVPLDENGVADGNSLRLSRRRATIEKLQDMKARIVVLAHRGDPNGIDLNMSLQPIVRSMMQKMKSGPCLWQSFARWKKFTPERCPWQQVMFYLLKIFVSLSEKQKRRRVFTRTGNAWRCFRKRCFWFATGNMPVLSASQNICRLLRGLRY